MADVVPKSYRLEAEKFSATPMWRTIPVTPFAIYQQSGDIIEPDMNFITCFTCEEYIVDFNARKFPNFLWLFPSPSLILNFLFSRVLA